MRVPSSNEQKDFDELVQNLATILIDSLNQAGIKGLLPDKELSQLEEEKDDPKSIDYLEAALYSCNVTDTGKYISFLRKLQQLRSAGSAHRKGKKYERQLKKNFGIENQEYRDRFARILPQAVETLEFFNRLIGRGELTRKSELPPLYDLNEHLHALLQILFPSGAEGVFENEAWIDKIDFETRHIANQLRTRGIDEFEGFSSEFRSLCENLIVSINSDVNPPDIRGMLTDIAKVFIAEAGSNLSNGINLLSDAQKTNVQLIEFFEHIAGKAAYCKKLVEYSRVLIKLDEVKDCDWYPYYVAQYLSYARACTLYAYEHVLHAEGLDSVPIILDAISAVQGAADAAEKVVNVDAIRETVKNLTQVANELSGDQ